MSVLKGDHRKYVSVQPGSSYWTLHQHFWLLMYIFLCIAWNGITNGPQDQFMLGFLPFVTIITSIFLVYWILGALWSRTEINACIAGRLYAFKGN